MCIGQFLKDYIYTYPTDGINLSTVLGLRYIKFYNYNSVFEKCDTYSDRKKNYSFRCPFLFLSSSRDNLRIKYKFTRLVYALDFKYNAKKTRRARKHVGITRTCLHPTITIRRSPTTLNLKNVSAVSRISLKFIVNVDEVELI